MDKVYIEKVNESYIRPVCSDAFRRELSDHFTFVVPNHQYTPSFKFGAWDGKIRLLNSNGTIYAGLIGNLVDYCTRHSVECTIDPKLNQNEFSLVEAQQFVDSLDLKYAPREHQLQAFVTAVRNNRALLISPTASGKSLIIMLLCKYYQGRKLIVVPTINLVNQLSDDMSNYDLTGEISFEIHKISGGQHTDSDKNIEILLENNEKLLLPGSQSVTLVNHKKKLAKDLDEEDEIDDRWLQKYQEK